mgnify:CR=1 FL=1
MLNTQMSNFQTMLKPKYPNCHSCESRNLRVEPDKIPAFTGMTILDFVIWILFDIGNWKFDIKHSTVIYP